MSGVCKLNFRSAPLKTQVTRSGRALIYNFETSFRKTAISMRSLVAANANKSGVKPRIVIRLCFRHDRLIANTSRHL